MTACPRCHTDAVFTDRDLYGIDESCLTCGWNGDTRNPSVNEHEESMALLVRKKLRLVRTQYEISPHLYELGAPTPRRKDFRTEIEFYRTYHKWYYNQNRTKVRAVS